MRFIATFFAMGLLMGCSDTGDASSTRSITEAEATSRVEALIHGTVEILKTHPTLQLVPYSATPTPCAFSNEGIPERYTIGRAYWLHKMPSEGLVDTAQQVVSSWRHDGHAITSSGGFDVGKPGVSATTADGYHLSLAWAEGDVLYLAATSPCLWPDGKAPNPAG
ncbi:hypothetical protein [Nonomuraea sp. NPDC048916]|uniref:hypothetical protein n=1 Tax=Nonomuraea sp. NPDC048916 TaxID=3154232 RepID=UPI0033FE6C89